MPGIERYAKPEFEQFSNLASSELTLDQWVTLARRLNEIFRTDPAIAGLVVTSGTDTLEELAYFLDLTVRSDRPVVVVGSMRNPARSGTRARPTSSRASGLPRPPTHAAKGRSSC
jgi:L-asparaginase/archaeal Glu-tRNAGln amidotransferase subunit D